MVVLANTERFEMVTPRYRLSTNGVRSRIVVPTLFGDCSGPAIARLVQEELALAARNKDSGATSERSRLIVGAIPFDSRKRPMLYIPRTVEWEDRLPLHSESCSVSLPAQAGGVEVELEPPDDPHYRRAVAESVRRIQSGVLDKVVLARTMSVAGSVDLDAVLRRLVQDNPAAYSYRVDLPYETGTPGTLIGASPELVLSSTNGAVCSHPLAGSVARTGDPAADRSRGERLLCSAKDHAEHDHVARRVGEAFRRHADEVIVPEQPELVQTPVLLHLGTRVTGKLRPGVSPLELLYDLHPTPAVCGWPRDKARSLIRELEGFDRGMYAGLVGWMDVNGNSEWALALRGGLVNGPNTTLYAGAGIVADSVPEAEHAETATKFSTFARALRP